MTTTQSQALDEAALEAAGLAYQQGMGATHRQCLEEAISAYLRASPVESGAALADSELIEKLQHTSTGRRAADRIADLSAEVERLTRERNTARAEAAELSGGWVLNRSIEAEARVKRMEEALRETVRLLVDLDMGRSIHNSRFPDSRIDGPLWGQITRVVTTARAALSDSPAPAASARADVPVVETATWRCTHKKTGSVEIREEPLADTPFNHKHWTWEPLYLGALVSASNYPANPEKVEGGYLYRWTDADGEQHEFIHDSPHLGRPAPDTTSSREGE